MKLFSKSGQRGQVAIFVALIFQILFVFFAMMINIGLLVHHKINLQNSVDLAAYYGAMKQAEVMNAVAHINFQIRQSLKLLTFRYRHMGQFGDLKYPGRPANNVYTDEAAEPANEHFPQFCIVYTPFDHTNVSGSETYCKESGRRSTYSIPKPPVPSYGGHGLFGFNTGFIAAVQSARKSIEDDCKEKRALSLFTMLSFVRSYKIDIAQRKQLAISLARRISSTTDTMKDLDNESIKTGIENTLKKNLTYQNKDNVEFTVENSLSNEKCGNPSDQDAPPRWLVEKFIWPIFWAFIGKCGGETMQYQGMPITENPFTSSSVDANLKQVIEDPKWKPLLQEIFPFIEEPDGTIPKTNYYKSSMGFEKNPWCMSYIAVKAKSKPKIPFSLPFGDVELEAKAYAKPFGATMGPWHKSRWSQSSNKSDSGELVEEISPPRIDPGQLLDGTMSLDPKYIVDFPRYIGDVAGTKSNLVQHSHYQVFKQFDRNTNKLSINMWDNLLDPNNDLFDKDSNQDHLAWGDTAPGTNTLQMRDWEIAAIVPDQYDLSYYSVEPDYYRNYYVRLKKSEQGFPFPVRGDLGMQHRAGYAQAPWDKFSIKDQIKKVIQDNAVFDFQGKLTYIPLRFDELLTSYKAAAPDNLVMDKNKNFGKCSTPIADSLPPDKATTGNCIIGGRVGYSVKIVDGDFLNQEQELGGAGVRGKILNPPPEGF